MASGKAAEPGSAPQGPEGPCPFRMEFPSTQKVLVSQLRILLTAVENNPTLYNAFESDRISFLNVEKWFYITEKLNECPGGIKLNTLGWKGVLRYWSENVKNGDVMSKNRIAYNKSNKSITLKEAKELTRLERRFYNFIKIEEPNAIANGTDTRNDGVDQLETTAPDATDNMKAKKQLKNASPREVINDENACPVEAKKRAMQFDELNMTREEESDAINKLEYVFRQNLGYEENQTLSEQLVRLQALSGKLEKNISTIQDRIHLMRDLWKNRCDE